MKRALNFILNQLGLIVVIAAGALLYFDHADLTWSFAAIVGTILMAVLVASELTYKSLKQELRRK